LSSFLSSVITQREIDRTPEQTGELEQKFKILFSLQQANKDFSIWLKNKEEMADGIAILFMDIDGFKSLNTKYTEAKVDKLILPVVQRLLKSLVAHRGRAYRHGGDEFLLILPNHSMHEAKTFSEKVREAFSAKSIHVDGTDEKITFSIGVALWPDHGNGFENILGAANQAKRSAKNLGGNCVQVSNNSTEGPVA
jgi:diguanylate cyclase (GGDEF)-like protein